MWPATQSVTPNTTQGTINMNSLPNETILSILWYLKPQDLRSVRGSCQWIFRLTDDDLFWKTKAWIEYCTPPALFTSNCSLSPYHRYILIYHCLKKRLSYPLPSRVVGSTFDFASKVLISYFGPTASEKEIEACY